MTPGDIRAMRKRGEISDETAAIWLEFAHGMRRADRWAHVKHVIGRVLLAPLRWLRLTRVR